MLKVTLGTSAGPCITDMIEQEHAYRTALTRAGRFAIAGRALELRSGQGETLLTFTVMDPLPLVGTPWRVYHFFNGYGW